MKEWLLTDEEIGSFKSKASRLANELAANTEGNFKQEDIEGIYADRAMLKAQAKKLIEWLDNHNHKEGFKSFFYLSIPLDDWNALKNEVGLEAKV